MCFRPAEADVRIPVKCRECGKRINPVQDVYPDFCPFCKCESPAEGAEAFVLPGTASLVAPAVPVPPKGPAA